MEHGHHHTERSYKVSQLILILLTFAAFTVMLNFNPDVSRVLFGLPVVTSGFLGVIGTVSLYKGRSEPLNERKIIAMLVNWAMVLLIFTIILSNTVYRL